MSEHQILVVDDVPQNRTLLCDILTHTGYLVAAAALGPEALEMLEKERIDLVLLDISMPQMNGYEVCRQLREDEELAHVPVIFLSALSETEDKLKAFEAGGVDYITKPFQYEEVRARVETHLRIRRLQVELEDKIVLLREAEELRESLVHMIVHDLRSPLTGVMASLQILEMQWAPRCNMLRALPFGQHRDYRRRLGGLSGPHLVEHMPRSAARRQF